MTSLAALSDRDLVELWNGGRMHEFHPGHPDQKVHGRKGARGIVPAARPSTPDAAPAPAVLLPNVLGHGQQKPTMSPAYSTLTSEQAAQMQTEMIGRNPPPWTRAQREAIRDYTGNDGFLRVNGVMRGHLDLGKHERQKVTTQIRHLAAAMRPTDRPLVVFRNSDLHALGIRSSDAATQFEELRKLQGRVLQDAAFVSTSLERDATGSKAPLRLEIEVPAGTPAAYVGEISDFPEEKELILGPGQRLQVVSIAGDPRQGERVVVQVRVVPRSGGEGTK